MERAVLVAVVALTTGLVMAWAGAAPLVALLGGAGAALVVAAAAWIASTVPSAPSPAPSDGDAGRAEPLRGEPVQ